MRPRADGSAAATTPPPPLPILGAGDAGGLDLPQGAPAIHLRDPGREPRRRVTYAPTENTVETFVLEGEHTRATFRTEIVSVDRDWVSFRSTCVAAERTPGSTLGGWDPSPLIDASVAGVMRTNGTMFELRFFGTGKAHQIFDGLPIAFVAFLALPAEPIGLGARWEQRNPTMGGVEQQYALQVVAWQGSTITIEGTKLYGSSRADVAVRGNGTIRVVVDARRLNQAIQIDAEMELIDRRTTPPRSQTQRTRLTTTLR